MMPPALPPGARRPRSRMLPALAVVTALYAVLDGAALGLLDAGFGIAARVPGLLGTSDADVEAVHRASAAGEARLTPRHREAALLLGLRVGLAAEFAGLGLQGDAAALAQRRALAATVVAEGALDALLGVAPAPVLVPRDLGELADLNGLIERDATGLAARIEAATTPRHRHLYLAGAHLGVHQAVLMADRGTPAPPFARQKIARHLALAGVPPHLREPLLVAPSGADRAQRLAAFDAALAALREALLAPRWPPPG